ncbi:MAG: hypothetical protein KJ043_00925 [Anaerolineae bacterium]|nr:hypothetical protein [Anaerolineae bacterium]
MDKWLNMGMLQTSKLAYQFTKPMLFAQSAQDAHEAMLRVLVRLDASSIAQTAIKRLYQTTFKPYPVTIGGVNLPHPFILAAGFVKGYGFENEQDALITGRQKNIIPGWRTMPNLVGAVEFGSFTRHPRMGNDGVVIWRDINTQSTQNRVGLKNPGAIGASAFLAQHQNDLPSIFGVNIAPTPGVDDPDQEKSDIIESISAFISRGVRPAWFTLNLSCPNTEDDPSSHQTEAKTRVLCRAIQDLLAHETDNTIPLWVKISPTLSDEQYRVLMRVFADEGVSAVIATNTIAMPTPDNPSVMAGVGGGKLHDQAVRVAGLLMGEKRGHDYAVDVIGCGGIQDPISYQHFRQHGVIVGQYWSGMIFKNPLMAGHILAELEHDA